MKKYLSMILVVAIATMLAIPAFAAQTPASVDVPGDYNLDVTLGINGELGHRYSMDIEYSGNMTFTYNKNDMEWVADKETGYSYNMKETGWTTATQNLTIYNHSDLKLGYKVTMAKATKYNGLTFKLNGGEYAQDTLPACTVGAEFGSVKATIAITVSGTVPHDAANDDNLGQLTVKFNAVP